MPVVTIYSLNQKSLSTRDCLPMYFMMSGLGPDVLRYSDSVRLISPIVA